MRVLTGLSGFWEGADELVVADSLAYSLFRIDLDQYYNAPTGTLYHRPAEQATGASSWAPKVRGVMIAAPPLFPAGSGY